MIETYHRLCREVAPATLIAVTKGAPLSTLQQLYEAGCRDFGENRIPEALEKKGQLPPDARFHYIGSLQSKKVPKTLGQFHLIHSVDTVSLAEKIAAASSRSGLTTHVLIQVNTSGEASKQGLTPAEWEENRTHLTEMQGIEVEGLMTMAPSSASPDELHRCFAALRELKGDLPHLSMGMSGDYPIALEEGATLLRIGSKIINAQN